jgi:carbonic anhydrase/acetyltransferase-like protein (isoleucine patch superfamily)
MVMPGVTLPEGCTVGAKSFVYTKNELTSWSVWIGNPIKLHKERNKERILELSQSSDFCKYKNNEK